MRFVKAVGLAVGLGLALAGLYRMVDWLDGVVSELIERVRAWWGLGIVGVATAVLGLAWVRYGGVRALERWGVVLKPLHPEPPGEGSAGPGDGAARKRPARPRDPRALR